MRLVTFTLLVSSFRSPLTTATTQQGPLKCHFDNGKTKGVRSCDLEPAGCMSALLRRSGEDRWFLKKGCSRLNGHNCSHTAEWNQIYDICRVHCCHTDHCNDTPEWDALVGKRSLSPSTNCSYAGELAVTEAPYVPPTRTTTRTSERTDTTASQRYTSAASLGTTSGAPKPTASAEPTASAGFPIWAIVAIAVAVLAFGVCLVVLIVVIASCGHRDGEQSSAEERSTLVQGTPRANEDEPTDRTQSMRSQCNSEVDFSRRVPPAVSSQRSIPESSQLSTSERNSNVAISQH